MVKLAYQETKKIISQSGQVLIEVLVALGVIVVVVSMVTISTATSLSNVEFSRTQNQATQYAQEGMEVIRSIRNNNVTNFTALSGSYCLAQDSSVLTQPAPCSVNIDNTFIRSVTIEKNNVAICAGGTKTTVLVSWTDGKCSSGSYCHNATIASCIAVTNVVPGL